MYPILVAQSTINKYVLPLYAATVLQYRYVIIIMVNVFNHELEYYPCTRRGQPVSLEIHFSSVYIYCPCFSPPAYYNTAATVVVQLLY